jgi:hypothetical protein
MASGNPKIAEAGKNTRFKKGQSGNPTGMPKGIKHISTWIQELMEDEEFESTIQQGLKIVEYKGAPIKAIIQAQMQKAINGDTKAFDSLGRYGWSQKIETENSGSQELIIKHVRG